MPTLPQRPRPPRRLGAVLVLLTPEERERVRAAAARAGLGVSPWLRTIALDAARVRR